MSTSPGHMKFVASRFVSCAQQPATAFSSSCAALLGVCAVAAWHELQESLHMAASAAPAVARQRVTMQAHGDRGGGGHSGGLC